MTTPSEPVSVVITQTEPDSVSISQTPPSNFGVSLAGPQGPEGRTAYQSAVDNGFVGTEQEWLDSLVGPVGPVGPGVPAGGSVGQVLTKNSSTDYDASWQPGVILMEATETAPSGAAVGSIIFRKGISTASDYDSFTNSTTPASFIKLQEASGTSLADSSGNGHGATLNGTATVNDTVDPAAPVVVGSHIRLNGGYLLCDNTTWLTPATTGFTFAGWFYVRSLSTWSRFLDFANTASVNDIYWAASDSSGTSRLQVNTSYITFPRVTTNVWTHIACTISNTGAARVYYNGSLIGSGTLDVPLNQARAYKYIGKSSASQDPLLSASVSKIAIWNGVLSADQVSLLSNINSGKPRGWWDGTSIQPLS